MSQKAKFIGRLFPGGHSVYKVTWIFLKCYSLYLSTSQWYKTAKSGQNALFRFTKCRKQVIMSTVMTLTQPRYPIGTSGYIILNFIKTTNGTSQEWLSPKYRSHFIETKLPTWRRKQQPTPVLLPGKSHGTEEPGRLYTVHGVAKSRTGLSDFTFTFHFHALEKETATHSSTLAWRTPGMGSLVGCCYGVA